LLGQSDAFSFYVSCLQCGYVLRAEEERRLLLGLKPTTEREAVLAGRVA